VPGSMKKNSALARNRMDGEGEKGGSCPRSNPRGQVAFLAAA